VSILMLVLQVLCFAVGLMMPVVILVALGPLHHRSQRRRASIARRETARRFEALDRAA